MKHLPNLLTLGNLFCGCIAIAYIDTALPYYIFKNNQFGPPSYEWVYGVRQMYLGSIFIGLAALFDLLDGWVARALNIHSPIGKDLDSLADVVSFGVAPSMILFQLLWDAQMADKGMGDVSLIGIAPAFLVACFAALRLAKYNVTSTQQKAHFIGMPTPAAGLFIATIPIMMWYSPFGFAVYLKIKWVIYAIIFILCYLMVSKRQFFKLIPQKFNIRFFWPQLLMVLIGVLSTIFLGINCLPVIFITYVVLSFVYRQPDLSISVKE